jgi:hypothetical protein
VTAMSATLTPMLAMSRTRPSPYARAMRLAHLGVVPAGMHGARLGVRVRMPRGRAPIQFARKAAVRRPRRVGRLATPVMASPVRSAARPSKVILHDGAGAQLLEAELGCNANVLAEGDDIFAVRVYSPARALLQSLYFCHRAAPPSAVDRHAKGYEVGAAAVPGGSADARHPQMALA